MVADCDFGVGRQAKTCARQEAMNVAFATWRGLNHFRVPGVSSGFLLKMATVNLDLGWWDLASSPQ